jgi:predicted permease
LSVHSLQGEVSGGIRGALLVLLGAALLVLLIACVNVTNLLLGRGVRRRGEFALRTALGAGQGRLVRQVLTESLLLALLGGAAGVAVASLGVRALVALSPPGLPRLGSVSVHGSVLLFALGLVLATALGFGLFPALQAAADPQGELSLATLRSTGGPHRARGALVVVETALAVVLLVSSGLPLRSLTRLFAVHPGFTGSQLLTLQVQTSGPRYAQNAATLAFFARALDAVRQVPGVAAAAFTSQLPLSGETDLYGVQFEPSVPDDPGEIRGTYRYAVSDGYLEAMGIPLKRGRLLTREDRGDAPPVALISESLARRRLAGKDPLGQQIRIGTAGPYTVVGVVGDVKQQSLAFDTPDAVYLPEEQWRFADNVMSLVVRMRPGQKAATLVPPLREAIWATDRDQPIVRVAMMDELIATGAAERRFAVVLIGAFAVTALLLAAAGIYGVLAGSVAERTRELGIRAALGASQQGLLGLVIRQGMTLTLLGAGLGVLGALAATKVLTTMLFGISRLDLTTYAGGVLLLAAVALVACGLPAWRASRLDPAGVLRSE